MHSPLDHMELDTFFKHLNAPLRTMPPQERAEVHQELRQHLDSLVAAYEELGASREQALGYALRSFGDPRRIGRRMYWEWYRSQWRGVSDEMKAVLSMLGLLTGLSLSLPFLTALLCFWIPYQLWHWTPDTGNFLIAVLLLGVPAIAGRILGRARPKHAVSGAFYATVALTSLPLLMGLVSLPWTRDFSPFGSIALWAGCWLASGCGAAHMSSRGRDRQEKFRRIGLKLF